MGVGLTDKIRTVGRFYKEKKMIWSSTPNIEGKSISNYHGVVTGEAVLGANGGMMMGTVSGTAVSVR